MKKTIAILLALVMVVGTILTGCGSEGGNDSGYAPADATALLEDVWAAYGEDEKFFAMGGDYTTMVDGAPGKVDVTVTADVDALLAVPADATALADDAASLIHAMNANTFTAGAFHLTDAADIETFTGLVEENIANRQWMCGFPEELTISTVGEYVVVAFGAADIMDVFVGHLQEVTGAEVAVEKPLA